MLELIKAFGLPQGAVSGLTSSVQFGFIIGTVLFALLCIVDRFSPSKVFMICACLGAVFNIGMIAKTNNYASLLILRFMTGFCLAGIYPVGMKIAADHYDKALGKSLGYLVGALVVGTALPHLLVELKGSLPWEFVQVATSLLAVVGGLSMVLFVPDGPHCTVSKGVDLAAIPKIFEDRSFRSAAFGYFGHMWELYAFWAFVPVLLTLFQNTNPSTSVDIPLLSFLIIGVGGFGCISAGYFAQRWGAKLVASLALASSCICCIIMPLVFTSNSLVIFLAFLMFWGMVVVADSPLFSTLVAQRAPTQLKGTALTIVNSIGFLVTIISIQLISYLQHVFVSPSIFILLAVGPILGLRALRNEGSVDS